ncbi:hypothetical protein ID866_9895 [Astraeus odoratus]|nr:hypothetical protein ID866_9895 [Astraeus odoratus]
MNPPTFPFTEDELNKAGLLGEEVSQITTQVIKTMTEHPELLNLSLFALQCINLEGQQSKGPSLPSSLVPSDLSMSSSLSTLTFPSDSIISSKYGPDEYERTTYYNGITEYGGHPALVYCSDFLTTPFLKPTGRYGHILINVPLATEQMENEDSQGTLTLWFHENKDKDGKPGNRVYGVSNCHVLHKNTTVDYEHKHEIVRLEANVVKDAREIQQIQNELDKEKESITKLETLYNEVTEFWSDIKLHHNIGHVQYAAAITVDEGSTLYTSDWAAFLAAETKVKDHFEGNVVDLGSKYSPPELIHMFYPLSGGPTMSKFPKGRKLQIVGCTTKEDLANPAEFDSKGQHCLMVSKDGNTTDLTVGHYAGLMLFTCNEVGIESVELGIYNAGVKTAKTFSNKGDSGSLVWHMRDGKAYMVGQLHSGCNKGGWTNNHISYCTPAWYLLTKIKEKYKYADFYRTTWSA